MTSTKCAGLAVFAFVCAASACVSPSAFAADRSGHYVIGGGVGGVPCADFLDVMAKARLAGGLHSVAGSELTNAYSNYVLGFQTAYNHQTPGVRDVFAAFRDPGDEILYAIESQQCRERPEERFGQALLNLVAGLRKRSK